jgi:hypothetical protein
MVSIKQEEAKQNRGLLQYILKRTPFTQFIVQENGLNDDRFMEWAFHPGMLFGALNKWWGCQGERTRPHEGLDLCFYKDRHNKIFRLGKKTKIPVMYDGVIVKVMDDFLGQSVLVEHRLSDLTMSRFYSIYGHTVPNGNLKVGMDVKQGGIIATIADAAQTKKNVLSHLHVSVGWSSQEIFYDQLDWDKISTQETLTLIDPLNILDGDYSILGIGE